MSTESATVDTKKSSFEPSKTQVDSQSTAVAVDPLDSTTRELQSTVDSSSVQDETLDLQQLADQFQFKATAQKDAMTVPSSIDVPDPVADPEASENHVFSSSGYVMDKGDMRELKAVDGIKAVQSDPAKLDQIIKSGKTGWTRWGSGFIVSGKLDPKSLGFLIPVMVNKSLTVAGKWMPIQVDYSQSATLLDAGQFQKLKTNLSDKQQGYYDRSKVKVTNINLNGGTKINEDSSVNDAQDASLLGQLGAFAARNSRFVRGQLQDQVDGMDTSSLAINKEDSKDATVEGTLGNMAAAFKNIAANYLSDFFPDTGFALQSTVITGVGTLVDYKGVFQLIDGQQGVEICSSFKVGTDDQNEVTYLGSSIAAVKNLELGNEIFKVQLNSTDELLHLDGNGAHLWLTGSDWAFSVLGNDIPVAAAGNFYYDLSNKGFYGNFEDIPLNLDLFGVSLVFQFAGIHLDQSALKIGSVKSIIDQLILFDSIKAGPTELELLHLDKGNLEIKGASSLATTQSLAIGGAVLENLGGDLVYSYKKGVSKVSVTNGNVKVTIAGFTAAVEGFSFDALRDELLFDSLTLEGTAFEKNLALEVTGFSIDSSDHYTFENAAGTIDTLSFLEGKIVLNNIEIGGSKDAGDLSLFASTAIEASDLSLIDELVIVNELSGTAAITSDLEEFHLAFNDFNATATIFDFTTTVTGLNYNQKEDQLTADNFTTDGELAGSSLHLSINGISYAHGKPMSFTNATGTLDQIALLEGKVKLSNITLSVENKGDDLELTGNSDLISESIAAKPIQIHSLSGTASFSHSKTEGTDISVAGLKLNATIFKADTVISDLNYSYKEKELTVKTFESIIPVLDKEVTFVAHQLSYKDGNLGLDSLTGTVDKISILEDKIAASNIELNLSDGLNKIIGSAEIVAQDLGTESLKIESLTGGIQVEKSDATTSISITNGAFAVDVLNFKGSGTGIDYDQTKNELKLNDLTLNGKVLGQDLSLGVKNLTKDESGFSFTSIEGKVSSLKLSYKELGTVETGDFNVFIEDNGGDLIINADFSITPTIASLNLGFATITNAATSLQFEYDSSKKGLDYHFEKVSAEQVTFDFWGSKNIGVANTISYDPKKGEFNAASAAISLKTPDALGGQELVFTALAIGISKDKVDYEKATAAWGGGALDLSVLKLKAPDSITLDKISDSIVINNLKATFNYDPIAASGGGDLRISKTGEISMDRMSATISSAQLSVIPESIPGLWPFELSIDVPLMPGLYGSFALGAKGIALAQIGGEVVYENKVLSLNLTATASATLIAYLKAAIKAGIPFLAEIQAYLKGSAIMGMEKAAFSLTKKYDFKDGVFSDKSTEGSYSLDLGAKMAVDAGISGKLFFFERTLYEVHIKTWDLGSTSISNEFKSLATADLTGGLKTSGFLEEGKTPEVPVSLKPKQYTQGLDELGKIIGINFDFAEAQPIVDGTFLTLLKDKAASQQKNLHSTFETDKYEGISKKLEAEYDQKRTDYITNASKLDIAKTDKFRDRLNALSDTYKEKSLKRTIKLYENDINHFNFKVANALYDRISELTIEDLTGKDPEIKDAAEFIESMETAAASKFTVIKTAADESRLQRLTKVDQVIENTEGGFIKDNFGFDISSLDVESDEVAFSSETKSVLASEIDHFNSRRLEFYYRSQADYSELSDQKDPIFIKKKLDNDIAIARTKMLNTSQELEAIKIKYSEENLVIKADERGSIKTFRESKEQYILRKRTQREDQIKIKEAAILASQSLLNKLETDKKSQIDAYRAVKSGWLQHHDYLKNQLNEASDPKDYLKIKEQIKDLGLIKPML
jgi:hypothetical protein